MKSLAAQGLGSGGFVRPAGRIALVRGGQRSFRWSCLRARPTTFSTAHLPTSLPCRRWSSRSCWRSAPRTPSDVIFMKATGCGSSISRGEVRLRAHVNGAVQPGVVAARLNAARFAPDGNSINVLTSETLTDIGGGATFYSCLVEVEASTERPRKRECRGQTLSPLRAVRRLLSAQSLEPRAVQ